MSGAYSKGPWFAELGSDGTFGLYARTPTRGTHLIAEFYDQDMGDHLPAQANLTMAAAAPELLAACQRILPPNVATSNVNIADDFVIPLDVTMGELRALASAIAVATGEGL